MQHAVDDARVVPGRDPSRVDRVGLHDEVAELRERVAANAGNRRASARILADEIVHHVAAESALEIQHVVRNAERVADAPRVVHRIERAARAIGEVAVVAEELHRRADDVVALLDEERGGDRRVDSAGHRDENALSGRWTGRPVDRWTGTTNGAHRRQSAAAADTPRALATTAGKISDTRSIAASFESDPRLMRIAGVSEIRGNADRLEHVRRVDAPALARRSGGAGDAAEVQRHEHRLAVRAGHRDVDDVRRAAWRASSMNDRVRNARRDRLLEPVAQTLESRALFLALGDGQLGSASKARRSRRRSPCPARRPRSCVPPCSSGSMPMPRRMNIAPIPLGAPILWPETDARSNGIAAASIGDLAERLDGVGVEDRPDALGVGGQLGDRLDGADLVVHPHHAGDRRVVADDRARKTSRRRPLWRAPRTGAPPLPRAPPDGRRRALPCARWAR